MRTKKHVRSKRLLLAIAAAAPLLLAAATFSRSSLGDSAPAHPLEARLHPLSPRFCGIDIVEVGSVDSQNGEFTPQLALLQDRFDESFKGEAAPKIRRIYSYALAPDQEFVQRINSANRIVTDRYLHPRVITNFETVKTNILAYTLFTSLSTSSSSFGPLAGVMGSLANELLKFYRETRDFYRSQALYTLKIMQESRNESLLKLISDDTLLEATAVGNAASSLKALFIPDYLRKMVALYQQDEENSSRTPNYANLLSILNREGLLGVPLLKDFVLVYFDTKKAYGREPDFRYLDLVYDKNIKPNADGLVPLGVYALNKSGDRIMDADLTRPGKVERRYWAQRLTNFATQTGTAFLTFPLSFVLSAAPGGVQFFLEKEGNNLLTSTIQSQGELAALLQSGMVKLDPGLIDQIRAEIHVPIFTDRNQAPHFKENAAAMTAYLQARSEALCKEIGATREREFEKVYLSSWERIKRRWALFWRSSDRPESIEKTAEEREAVISARNKIVQARILLHFYDETRLSDTEDQVIAALQTVSALGNRADIPLIAKILEVSVAADLQKAALLSAMDMGETQLSLLFKHALLHVNSIQVRGMITRLGQIEFERTAKPDTAFARAIAALDLVIKARDTLLTGPALRVRTELARRRDSWREHTAPTVSAETHL